MKPITTLTNFSQSWLSAWPDTEEERNLKSLCLYNDKIIFSVSGNMCRSLIEAIAEDFDVEKRILRETFISVEDVSGNDNLIQTIFDYTIKPSDLLGEAQDTKATRRLLEDIATREGLSYEDFEDRISKNRNEAYGYYKETYYQKLSIISSLLIYKRVNSKIPCSLTAFSPGEGYVHESFIKNNNPQIHKSEIQYDNMVAEIDYILPSVNSLSWNEIFEIRKDKRIKEFRLWINTNKSQIQNEGIKNKIIEELWNVFKELKPNVLNNTIKATLGNFPLPLPVNPIGITTAINDISKDMQFNRDYEWLLFLHDTRERTNAINKK